MEAALNINALMAEERGRNIAGIIGNYSKRLLGFIRKRIGNDADAEDILQDVFYQLAGNTQPIEQLTAWLFRVARNRIVDVQRKHKPELLDDLYGKDDSSKSYLYGISENIYRVKSYENNFKQLFDKFTENCPIVEGLIMKRKNAKLEIGNSEKNNHRSQIKCRVKSKNYKY